MKKEKEKEFSIWENDSTTTGTTTDSERYLATLGRKAFLNFWSYSNPYTDEGNGKELCDFLVVFGNDIIIFSDKHCEFPQHGDIKVAWHRWYRSAIEKSVKQLLGAASFIKRFPTRIYLDASCQKPLPIALPASDVSRIHLIAVTRGSAKAAKKYWNNTSSSSLFINTTLKDLGDKEHPFMVGKPVYKNRFVHILDELTLDILLNELDTVSDFVGYLTKKEIFLTHSISDFLIAGEEELLATYFLNPSAETGEFSFPKLPSAKKLIDIGEGSWKTFSQSRTYWHWKKSLEASYDWDRLIEHQTSHIQKQSAEVVFKHDSHFDDIRVHEIVLRMMAQEKRIVRKNLAENHNELLTKNLKNSHVDRFTMILTVPPENKRAYVLMVLVQDPKTSYKEYRETRRLALVSYCQSIQLRYAEIEEVIGIASEEFISPDLSQDFVYMEFKEKISVDEKDKLFFLLQKAGVWKNNWVRIE